MIVFHGSNSNFKKLRISKSLVKHSTTELNEGYGIYFSTDIEVARSYGKYIYTLEIPDMYMADFRILTNCRKYVSSIRKEVLDKSGVDIGRLIDLDTISKNMYYGGLMICNLCNEVYLNLDSCEPWHTMSAKTRDKILAVLKTFDKKHLTAYMFNYNIKNIGVLKRVTADTVRIVSKTCSY